MPHTLSDEFERLRLQVRHFVQEELEPISLAVETREQIPEPIVDRMRQMGLFGLAIPKTYGGLGLTTLQEVMIYEEITQTNGCYRSRIGTKSFVLNAGPLCGVYVVLCNTGGGEAGSDSHLSTILVEAERAGVTVVDAGPMLGLRSMHIGTVRFEQVRVPLDHLVGSENGGREQVLTCFNERRIQAAAELLGVAEGAFERAFQHVAQREQFRRKIIDFQVTRQKLGDMATRIQAARLLTYQAASHFDDGGASDRLSAMAKLQATRTALAVCDEAVQLMGGYGYVQEYEVERFFRDARALGVLDGTQIAQKNIIAEGLVRAKGSLSIS